MVSDGKGAEGIDDFCLCWEDSRVFQHGDRIVIVVGGDEVVGEKGVWF
jgi:hypothetical protein